MNVAQALHNVEKVSKSLQDTWQKLSLQKDGLARAKEGRPSSAEERLADVAASEALVGIQLSLEESMQTRRHLKAQLRAARAAAAAALVEVPPSSELSHILPVS